MNRIFLSAPCIIGNEQKYVNECIETNFVSSVGPFVERFEREFAKYVGAKYAIACASGTAALHVALRLIGIEPGDEVWVPTFTFVASANPVAYQYGRVTFFDSEYETWNIDPRLVQKEIERRCKNGTALPKAIVLVHIYGHPANGEPIRNICARHGIELIEDATESLGAKYATGNLKDKHTGILGRIGSFSFNGNKLITTGGGGMLVTDDAGLAERAKSLTTQARLPGLEYRHAEVGYNYRMTNIAAAMGVGQLEQIGELLARKSRIAAMYDAELRSLPGVTLPPRASWAAPSMWMYSILIDPTIAPCDARKLQRDLAGKNIECRPLWTPLHEAEYFKAALVGSENVAGTLFNHGISLPCSCSMTPVEQEFVVSEIKKSFNAS